MLPSLVLALLLAAEPPAEARVRLPPVDECSTDASFVAFRTALNEAVDRRDRDALLALVADNIEVDFGGGAGRNHFAQTWELDRPADSRLWDELGQALRLGCVRDPEGGYFISPSFSAEELENADPFETALAIRPGTEFLAAIAHTGGVVALLDWDVVTVPDWDFEAPWQRVVLGDGHTGYVRTQDLRSLLDYRAFFGRVNGEWRLVTFIAGD